MAERNQNVMDMVIDELQKDPGASLESLYGRAREIDPSVGELSLRQFHARYPLQVKRSKSRGTAGKTGGRTQKKRESGSAERSAEKQPARRARKSPSANGAPSGLDREQVRRLFLEFATDFAAAESRTEIVKAISSVDDYVDRLAKLIPR